MLVTGKTKTAFSLVEILISMGIFSIIITSVVFITISMVNAQKKIQARLFLTQTAQTTLESMSRQLRYGYSYSAATPADSFGTGGEIVINKDDAPSDSSSATSTIIVTPGINSPYVLFESQDGNPNAFQDQNAFCIYNRKLYKITNFDIDTGGLGEYSAKCSDGKPMLPEDIFVEFLAFDVFSDEIDNPRSPRVRIRMKLESEIGGIIELQTTVTQRLVTYF